LCGLVVGEGSDNDDIEPVLLSITDRRSIACLRRPSAMLVLVLVLVFVVLLETLLDLNARKAPNLAFELCIWLTSAEVSYGYGVWRAYG
jgi:hypothetical protein